MVSVKTMVDSRSRTEDLTQCKPFWWSKRTVEIDHLHVMDFRCLNQPFQCLDDVFSMLATDSPNDQSFSSRGNHDQPRIYQFSLIGAFRGRGSAVILMEDTKKLVLMEQHIPDNMVYICLFDFVCKNCGSKCGGLTSIANCFFGARVLVQAIQCGGYASREVVISYWHPFIHVIHVDFINPKTRQQLVYNKD